VVLLCALPPLPDGTKTVQVFMEPVREPEFGGKPVWRMVQQYVYKDAGSRTIYRRNLGTFIEGAASASSPSAEVRGPVVEDEKGVLPQA